MGDREPPKLQRVLWSAEPVQWQKSGTIRPQMSPSHMRCGRWVHVHWDDSVGEDCCIDREEINVWIDSSSLAIIVILEKDGAMMRVGCTPPTIPQTSA